MVTCVGKKCIEIRTTWISSSISPDINDEIMSFIVSKLAPESYKKERKPKIDVNKVWKPNKLQQL